MMDSSNQPLVADPDFSPPQGAIPVWTKVFTKPGEQTFIEITQHRDATAKSAYVWVFLAGALAGLISTMLQFITAMLGVQQVAQDYGGLPGSPAAYGVGGLVWAICSAPSAGVGSVVWFAITTGVIHATARFFGGQGTFDKLAYAMGAVAAPISLLSALTIPLNAIPFAVFCTAPVMIIAGLYSLYLQVAAVKAVHRCGWGEAAAAYFLPGLLLVLLCGVGLLLVMRAIGPELNEIFRQIQQLQQ
jgi:hypothetical protein